MRYGFGYCAGFCLATLVSMLVAACEDNSFATAGDGGVISDAGMTVGGDSGMSGADGGSISPTFASVYNTILVTKCKSCHGNSGGFDLGDTKEDAYAALVTNNASGGSCSGMGKYVTANDSAGSLLVQMISAAGTCGDVPRMPTNGNLTAAQIQLVSTWIGQGAQNN